MPAPTSRSPFVKLTVLALLIGGGFMLAWHLGFFRLAEPKEMAATIRALRDRPFIAPLFVIAYAIAATFGLPASVLSLLGGAIFGFELGTLLTWAGASIGATSGFLLARALGLDAVRKLLGSRADRLTDSMGKHGFMTILRLRLIPVVPYNLTNFAAGLAGVRLRDFVLATVIGLLPICAAYAYFADALMSGADGARHDALIRVLVVGTLFVAISFLPRLFRKK